MKGIVMILLFAITGSFVFGQHTSYTVSFPNAVHHEASISMKVTGISGGTLLFRMSRSSPGRYATHEFGKNVYNVRAGNGYGHLSVKRVDGDVYEVSGIKDSVLLHYTLYGNHADGTYAGIDEASIHLNMPACFLWAEGMEQAPIDITFMVPDPSFTIATQLPPGKQQYTFTAPNLQYFMDSPTKIGKLHWREWQVKNKDGLTQTIRLALEANASEAGVDSLKDYLRKITEQSAKVFGEYPKYDYGSYTFIASINPYVQGDGMEHRNSTMIALPMPFTANPRALGVFAHEFFHCWNVERIRPATLEPFNFRKSNMSNELWCAEGFTQYYGDLLMRRAGLLPDSGFAETAGFIVNAKTNTPGCRWYTPIQASNMAVFTDAGSSIDRNNFSNITTSYYTYGAAIALALDLELRSKFNTSLDVFMQEMWKQHGAVEKGYTVEDMEQALKAITNATFAKSFFTGYVYGSDLPDYTTLLRKGGFTLQLSNADKGWLGSFRTMDKKGVVITSNTLRGTPAYMAGLDVNDVIIAVDGTSVAEATAMNKIIAGHKPNDVIKITYLHRGTEKQVSVMLYPNPELEVIPAERNGELSQEVQQFRKNWLQAK